LCIPPWMLGFLVFTLGPIIATVYLSLTEYNMFMPPNFIGLQNYRHMFTNDNLFWQALKVTTIYPFASVPLGIIAGYSLALLLNQRIKGLALFRTIFYMPAVVSGVAVAIVFQWIFNPELGLVNAILSYFGIKGPMWFASRQWALPTMILMSLWGVGGGTVIYLAGLQGVPTELYEAAELDGASAWQRLIHITIPITTPVIFFQLIMGLIGTFQTFTQAYVITNGGPANATLFYVLYLYRTGWQYFQMGYASSLAWVLFLIILCFTVILFRSSRHWVYYEAQSRG